MPTKIMIIRHGEKPADNDSVRGVDESGSHDSSELSVRGWQRAGALVRFFAPLNGAFSHPALATPTTLFAAKPRNGAKSVRSEHTLLPLAQVLNKNIDLRFAPGEEGKLTEAVLRTDGVILIAWEHNAIPGIVDSITGGDHTCPKRWPDPRFDIVWILDQKSPSKWVFSQAPQCVLPADSADVIELVKAGKS